MLLDCRRLPASSRSLPANTATPTREPRTSESARTASRTSVAATPVALSRHPRAADGHGADAVERDPDGVVLHGHVADERARRADLRRGRREGDARATAAPGEHARDRAARRPAHRDARAGGAQTVQDVTVDAVDDHAAGDRQAADRDRGRVAQADRAAHAGAIADQTQPALGGAADLDAAPVGPGRDADRVARPRAIDRPLDAAGPDVQDATGGRRAVRRLGGDAAGRVGARRHGGGHRDGDGATHRRGTSRPSRRPGGRRRGSGRASGPGCPRESER